MHAVDEIEDQQLDNLIACALFHAKQASRGLAGELDRRVRGWIRANSTMGAGALHKWAAKDSLAPRLPQQALDSEGTRLLTPTEMLRHWRAKWSTRWQQHQDRFLQLRFEICKLRHEIRSGSIDHGLEGGIHSDTLRAQARLYKTEAGMGADRWRAQDLANLPQQAFSALGGFLETCERELAWPPQWLAMFTSLLPKSEVDERPFAVAPLLYILWCRARGHEADDLCSARAGFWDTAVRGSSALRAGIQRMLMNETNQWLQFRSAMVCWDLENFYNSICLHRLIASMLALSFLPAIIVMTFTMYFAPRFLRGLGSVAEPIYPANSILQGCGFACHFARGLLHSLLDHVRRLYPVELTEFVDDITHKVEGTGASVLRVFPQSVEYVAREVRALGLTVSLKSGLVASSRDFCRLLLKAESGVRMGLQDHNRDLGLDAYTGRRPRKRIALRRRQRAALRAGKVSYLRSLNAPGRRLFLGDVWRAAVWALSDGGAYSSKAGSASVLYARSRQMSHVTACPGDGRA